MKEYRVNYIIPMCVVNDNNVKGQDYKYRVKSINFLLEHFLAKQTKINLFVYLIEQSIDGEHRMLPLIKIPPGLRGKKVYVKYEVFNKCWLYNIGARISKGEHLLFAESDVFSYHDYLKNFMRFADNKGWKWGFAWNNIYYVSELEKEKVFDGIDIFNSIDNKEFKRPSPHRKEGGIVYFNRTFFNSIGGYNEFIEELGGPDSDIAARARRKTKYNKSYPSLIYHIWHPKIIDKHRATRKRNKRILKYVFGHAHHMNTFLCKNEYGSMEGPLCKDKSLGI